MPGYANLFDRLFELQTPLAIARHCESPNKVIELDPHNIYHWKMESISMEDDSLGIPPLLNVIKDIWLNQVYKKGQESIALEHIHPLTLLSPAPPPGGAAPHMNTDLLTWKNNIQNIITMIGSRINFSRKPMSVNPSFAGLFNLPRNTRWYIHSIYTAPRTIPKAATLP